MHRTPIISSKILNDWVGHEILFKAECLQKIGAFKARGACNTLAKLVENGQKPKRIVACSSGNHAQAVAKFSTHFGFDSTIYMPAFVSTIKAQATTSYGAKVVLCSTREESDEKLVSASKEPNLYCIPPYDHKDVVAGQGTAMLEAFEDGGKVDAVFTPCGGGGLLSGTYIAAKHYLPDVSVFGVEPALADDAARSVKCGEIQTLPTTPNTIADGVRTLSVGKLTFPILQQVDNIYTVGEKQIIYWTQWLNHLLKVAIEPSSAMCMDAVLQWLATQDSPRKVMVILSGGNMDGATRLKVWQQDFLTDVPRPLELSMESSTTL